MNSCPGVGRRGSMCFETTHLHTDSSTSEVFEALGIQSYSHMMIGMSNHLLSIVFNVFRFHYHSQKVIGSLGNEGFSILRPPFFETDS